MAHADTLESSSDSLQDCIHQYHPALYKLEHRSDADHKVQFLSDAAKCIPPSTKAILEHVSAESKENDDLAAQLLQTDDDMLNESDIAIKQGSYKKSVPKFCATRWTARVDTLSAIIAKYKLILEALEQIQDTSNGDAKGMHDQRQ